MRYPRFQSLKLNVNITLYTSNFLGSTSFLKINNFYIDLTKKKIEKFEATLRISC